MYTALRTRGVEAKLVVFPDENHFIAKPVNRKFWYDTVVGWLVGHLKQGQ
jgi:dipeptidyl aminopeptidase/acylaminoacyl peptidase